MENVARGRSTFQAEHNCHFDASDHTKVNIFPLSHPPSASHHVKIVVWCSYEESVFYFVHRRQHMEPYYGGCIQDCQLLACYTTGRNSSSHVSTGSITLCAQS